MKSFAFFALIAVSLLACSKQDDENLVVTDTEFNLVYGSTAAEQVFAADRDADGNYLLAGTIKSQNGDPGNPDAWVLHLDRQGKILWQKNFGGSAHDGASAIASTKDGGSVFAGYTHSNDGDVSGNHGNSDAWVVKLDKSGNKEWQTSLGGSASDHASSILQTNDGGFILAGQTASTNGDVSNNHGGTDAWVVKLDRNGNKQWQKTLGGTGSEGAQSVMETSLGGYIMAGYTNSNDGDVTGYHPGWGMNLGSFDGWVVSLSNDGNILWNKAFGGSRSEVINSLIRGMDNSYTMAGYTRSNNDGDVGANHGDVDVWAVNIDKEGKLQWQKTLGGISGDMANFATATQDGGYMLAGITSSNEGDVTGNHGAEDAWLVKLDKDGNKQWQRALGGSGYDLARVVMQRANGSYIMVGATGSKDGDLAGQQGAGGVWIITLKEP